MKIIVLCSEIIGGAEIFTLERMLKGGEVQSVLYCNTKLANDILSDSRYININVIARDCLNDLAVSISMRNIVHAVSGLESILRNENILFGNLRSAALLLHPAVNGKNDAFVHDNCHYLDIKARILVALVVARSRRTSFPCHHSTLCVPFHRLLKPRIAIDFFDKYLPLRDAKRPLPASINMAVIGRIEPAKNQRLAFNIANCFAQIGCEVQLTLVGSQSDAMYYSALMAADRHPALQIFQQEVRRSEIPGLLKKQDLIVHTSVAESLPLVLFETNALGIPFFALPVGGIPEVLPREYWLDLDANKSVQQIVSTLFRT